MFQTDPKKIGALLWSKVLR